MPSRVTVSRIRDFMIELLVVEHRCGREKKTAAPPGG
jgi:hypothetical protein